MGIGSPFCLSRGLSPLVEGVRMLLMGKKGKPTKGAAQAASSAGFPSALWLLDGAKRRQR